LSAKTYIVTNSTATTTAAPVKQPTGSAIRTMLQLAPATGVPIRVVEWGCSFDASAAGVPGQVEVFGTTVAATMSTAFAAGDVMPFGDPNAVANTAGSSGVPLNLSTTTSGFATAAVTEGTVANYRLCDAQQVSPTNQYLKQFPLSREWEMLGGQFLRVRATFPATVNMTVYVLFEV
jgi:hypothetical protein